MVVAAAVVVMDAVASIRGLIDCRFDGFYCVWSWRIRGIFIVRARVHVVDETTDSNDSVLVMRWTIMDTD